MSSETDDQASVENKASDVISPQKPTVLFAVLVCEVIVIFLMNTFTLIVFATNQNLRKRTTYLIMNLTAADLLVGTVTALSDEYIPAKHRESSIILKVLINLFPVSSLANLCLISLERLHATIFPFRHCLIREWIYFKIIIGSWLTALLLSSGMVVLDSYVSDLTQYAVASYIVLTLLILAISYVIIIVNVKSSPASQPFGAVSSNKKLSVTLFIVAIASVLTILPWAIHAVIPVSLYANAKTVSISYSLLMIFYASSIMNPFIYAIRMQQFRKAVKELLCRKRTLDSRRVQPIELHAT